MLHPLDKRQLGDCFYLVIDLDRAEEEIQLALEHQYQVEQATNAMLNGSVSPEELMEMIEPFIPDMDQYQDEVEQNLADLSQQWQIQLVD